MVKQKTLLPDFKLPIHPATLLQLMDFINKPSHATLLESTSTTYTYELARSTAAKLLSLSADALATYPYYYETAPGNEAASIEAVREINMFVSRKVPGKQTIRRVVFLPLVEQMSLAAQNALLKTIEEPPADTAFFCTAYSSRKILPTVMSRLRTIRVLNPEQSQAEAYFTQLGYAGDSIRQAYELSSGNIDETGYMLNPDDKGVNILNQVKSVISSQPFERLLLVDQLAKDKPTALLFVRVMERLATASLEHTAKNKSMHSKRWYQTAKAAYEAREALIKNANVKLVLTELMLEI